MKILITNDDSVSAPQLLPLIKKCMEFAEVTVVVPKFEQSAKSHSIQIRDAFEIRQVELEPGISAWVVDSTPADCVRFAVSGLKMTFDLVISGINRGMNMGGACVYSGTVASALEASMCGAQAMAVSLCVEDWGVETDFGPAARVALRVLDWMRAHPLPLGVIYSLNVPQLPFEAIRGIAAAKLAPVFLDEPYYESAPEGGWLYRGRGRDFDPTGTDVGLCRQGFATMTKLTWDFRLNADDSELNEIEL